MKLILKDFVHIIDTKRVNVKSIVVRQHNEVLNAFAWSGDIRRNNIYSSAKSVTSTGLGIATAEGLFDLDEKPAEIFPEYLPENPQQWLLDMTMRDVLKMAGGHKANLLSPSYRDAMEEKNWTRHVMHQPIAYQPGTRFEYSNLGAWLGSVIIQKRTGQTLNDWLKPRLFEPMGMMNTQWLTCPLGSSLGLGGLLLTTFEMAQMGQLWLNKGMWEGKRLVPAAYLEEATAKQIDGSEMTESPTKDFHQGYGYGFWRYSQPDSYGAFGNLGQFIIVLPHHDAVVAVQSEEYERTQITFDAIWDTILPQLEKTK